MVYGVRGNGPPGPGWSTAYGTCSRPIFSFTVVVRVLSLPLVFRQLSSLRNRVPLGHCKCSFDENRVDVEDCVLHKMGCLSTTEVTIEAVDRSPVTRSCHHFEDGVPFGQGPAKLVEKLPGYTAGEPVIVCTDCAITESRGLHHQ